MAYRDTVPAPDDCFFPYINLNTAAKIQTAAIKIDITIRNREKLYSFSGLNLS